MKQFKKSVLFAIPLILAATFNSCSEKKVPDSRPHIILVMADDQGWGDMAHNGHPVVKTPNFDNLAASGLRFDRFYAAAPVCSPTRGSVMTGRHPNRFGCFSWGNTLRPQEITIAEVLQSAGYVTGHFGKWHLGSVQVGSPVNPGTSGFDEWFSAPNFFENDPILSREGAAVQLNGESSEVTVDAAIEFIRKHVNSDKPVFSVVWFGSPHLPHIASAADSALYPGLDPAWQHFYGEITGMDRAIGKLRQELKNLGMDKNTLLWYCSDNGGLPNVGTTGGRGHKGQIYEGGLRVPAIIEWPEKIDKPKSTSLPANTFDIFPTLLEVAGVIPENLPVLDGISLLPAMEEKMKNRPQPMGFWQYPAPGRRTPSAQWMAELFEAQKQGKMVSDSSRLVLEAGDISAQYPEDSFPGHAAWLDWPWKLHRIQNNSGDIKLELYQLENDSLEQNNLAEIESAKVESMLSQLEEWQHSVITSLNGNDYH
ncbi:sulfatase-like hydrolase/transferase [Mariniphaga sp.]|uniref:sulfatase-like hydrolase/transferase n=1 Tax=Mariniphaga sp. TaxID=1954475 RepID=UPI00356A9776